MEFGSSESTESRGGDSPRASWSVRPAMFIAPCLPEAACLSGYSEAGMEEDSPAEPRAFTRTSSLVHKHHDPSWWHFRGSAVEPLGVMPPWEKWFPGGGPWDHIAQFHFLSTLCFWFRQALKRSGVPRACSCQHRSCLLPGFPLSTGVMPSS